MPATAVIHVMIFCLELSLAHPKLANQAIPYPLAITHPPSQNFPSTDAPPVRQWGRPVRTAHDFYNRHKEVT
jgi:hypothetical protein